MTLSAYSHSTPNHPIPTDFSYALELPTKEAISPYYEFHKQHLSHASSGFKQLPVPFGMSTKEALGMFEVWSRKGLVGKCEFRYGLSCEEVSFGGWGKRRRVLLRVDIGAGARTGYHKDRATLRSNTRPHRTVPLWFDWLVQPHKPDPWPCPSPNHPHFPPSSPWLIAPISELSAQTAHPLTRSL